MRGTERVSRIRTRREFLLSTAAVFVSPLLINGSSLPQGVFIHDGFGDLERELIAESIRSVSAKYDLRGLQVDFINGKGLGRSFYGAAYHNLGFVPQITHTEAGMFARQRALEAREDFIGLFGHEMFLRHAGRNVVALKDAETLREEYPADSLVVCSLYVRKSSPELWYKLVAIHELAHVLFAGAGPAACYGLLKVIQRANQPLMSAGFRTVDSFDPGFNQGHPGHVDCYTFNRFLTLDNSRQSASEDFAQILAFHLLDLPMSHRDEILITKFAVVRTFMDSYYGAGTGSPAN